MYLVTGATGFVGIRLIHSLMSSNMNFRILSRKTVPDLDCFTCDFTELTSIPKAVFKNIDTIFHLAGFTHDLRDSSKIERLYHAVNVDATVRLAELAVQSGVKRFVFVSSVKAGGSAVTGRCMAEEEQSEPEGIYGKTKREAEEKLLEIGRQSGMHVSIVRPSLVYGPNVKGNLKLMLLGIENGWFPPLPETENKRSMIHVDDLVRAILLVAKDKRANGEIFIATDSMSYSSREIYEVMCGVVGRSILKWSVPKFLFDMAALINPHIKYKIDKLLGDECYSSEKLRALGFRSQKTLKDMNETSF